MIVTSAELKDFRNYERTSVELGPGVTVVHGDNGAGKTNLLEAIYFGLTARSCRTRNEREMVRHAAPATHVKITATDEDGPHVFEVGFAPGEQKRVWVDGASPDRASAATRRPLVSVFAPDRLDLVKGAPALRRSHLDALITAVWPSRSPTRASYSAALGQRNALIARIRAGSARSDLLDPWDAELARHGIALMGDRLAVVDDLAEHFARRAVEFGLPEACAVEYRPRSRAESISDLQGELTERREQDLRRGFSSHGPHRDDLALIHGGRQLRAYGSQGQQRAGLLALLFAERDLLLDTARPPLMLLDDVLSELDRARRARLLAAITEAGQTIITATEPPLAAAGSAPAMIAIASGRAEPMPAPLDAVA